MTDFEMVSELVKRTGVSYSEANRAFVASGKDMLAAIIMLENESGAKAKVYEEYSRARRRKYKVMAAKGIRTGADAAGSVLGKLCRTIIVVSGERDMFNIPVIISLFLLPLFEVLLPVMIISLFFGVSYRLTGPDLSKDIVIGITKHRRTSASPSVIDAEYRCKSEVYTDNGFFN